MKEYDLDTGQIDGLAVSRKAGARAGERDMEHNEPIGTERVGGLASRNLDTSVPVDGEASTIWRRATASPLEGQQLFRQLQRDYGNRYTQRFMDIARKGQKETEVGADVEQTIASKRGGGQALDQGVQEQIGSALDADFSGVRVHTDQESDSLNREINARAFTTGQDVFFREGAYNPGSSSGRELLAHELTHVVQQTEGVKKKMTLGQPGDIYEQEADEAARAVMQQEQRATSTETGTDKAQRQTEEEEPLAAKPQESAIQSQEMPEEEEEVQTQPEPEKLRRQEEPEEEETPVSAKGESGEIHRQAEEEEEETLSASPDPGDIERQAEEEEEAVSAQLEPGEVRRQEEEKEEGLGGT